MMEAGRMEKRQYVIVPYAVHDGVPSFKDSEIAEWFHRIKAEETLRWLFFDGSVTTAEELVRVVKAGGSFWFTVWTGRQNAEGEGEGVKLEMAGFFWISNFMGNSAYFHYVIYKKFWGTESRKIGRAVLNCIFGIGAADHMPMVGQLLGLTPINNVPAVRYAREAGFEMVGKIPGVYYDIYENKAVDGVLRYINREILAKHAKE
jgi:hypothetical protein